MLCAKALHLVVTCLHRWSRVVDASLTGLDPVSVRAPISCYLESVRVTAQNPSQVKSWRAGPT